MKYFWALFLLSNAVFVSGQSSIIDSILISGNKKTKSRVILRELTFQEGSSLPDNIDISEIETFNEQRLLSLGLFNDAKVSIDSNVANISVNENWYIFPNPIFELADRNFNFWWYDQQRDLSRVNYGLRAEHINLTGNRDKLSTTFQLGYTRKLELKYNFPFLDKAGKWTTSINAFYSDVKEIAYKTEGNKTLFAKFNDEIMLTRARIGFDIGYRPDLFASHGFRLEFHNNRINKYAASELNPDYFLEGKTNNRFFFFNYTYSLDRRAFKIFPESGDYFHLNLKKEGLYIFNDYNYLSLAAEYEQYFNAHSKWIWNYRIKGKAQIIRNKLPFANNTGLGYREDVLRGYELYVIDGSDYIYFRTGFHHKLFENTYNLSKIIPIRQFNKIDLKFYLSLEYDVGYVNEKYYTETNTFNNRLIYGYGPSFSIMLYNTYLFTVDYSWNHTGESGVFFSNKIAF